MFCAVGCVYKNGSKQPDFIGSPVISKYKVKLDVVPSYSYTLLRECNELSVVCAVLD
jgi:hypothetical protein